MDITINDLYMNYVLHNKDINELKLFSNKSVPTLRKYIVIKENLNDELFSLLGQKKITLDIAFFICNHILNPEYQLLIYPSLNNISTPLKKQLVKEHMFCDICSDNTKIMELTPCCNTKICLQCLLNVIGTSLNDISFQLISCPFCRDAYSFDYLREILRMNLFHNDNYSSIEPWRNKKEYTYIVNNRGIFYLQNLYRRYVHLAHKVTQIDTIWHETLKIMQEKMESYIFGFCHDCFRKWFRNEHQFIRLQHHRIIKHLPKVGIGRIRKQCINNDVVIRKDMFRCPPCLERNLDGHFKECPHCGIKTLRPDGCNYVRCQCKNRWCFVCNLRLPNTPDGHNTHYFIGRGSSAYDDKCRISEEYMGEKHILQTCNCNECSKRKGSPLCSTIDCKEKTEYRKEYMISNNGLYYNIKCNKCLGI